MKLTVTTAALMGIMLAGCATPHVVERNKLTDTQLSCTQIQDEIAEADRYRQEAESEKGVTGKNVAAAVFFWPAAVATHMNSDKAIDAAEDRKDNLIVLYRDRGCDNNAVSSTR